MKGHDSLPADMRIAVVRALHGLGDMLCAIPALTALRRAHPGAHITLIGLPNCGWLLERFGHLVDALLPFPGFPGIPERPYSPATLEAFLAAVHLQPFDLALQMHGSGRVSNDFVALLRARAAAGLYEVGRRRPAGRFFPYRDHGPEAQRWLYLTRSLDLPSEDERTAFPVSAADRAALENHPSLGELTASRFVCVHAGARAPDRRWPPGRFAKIADALANRGYRIVLTGTAQEQTTATAVAAGMRTRPVDVSGRTSLGLFSALLERAALLITNDTGPSHLAAALRTPSVVVFLASDPDRWAPPDRQLHRAILGCNVVKGEAQTLRRSTEAVPPAHEVLNEAFELLERGVAE